MPRTKRPKKGRQTKPNESANTELDPNIVIKQEPEDPPPESMEFEAEADGNLDEDNYPLQVSKVNQSANMYSVTQLRKLGEDMLNKQRKFFDQKRQKAISVIDVIKMKIPLEIRNVPVGEVFRKQGLKPSCSNDLLSVSQQVGNNDSTALSVEQTNKTVISDVQKECTADTENAFPSTSKFKTPAVGLPTPRIGTITPKVGPDSPITILRRPKLGEVVVSMKGSPVMLNAAREDKPTLNIPMANGTVMSILPQRGLRTAQLPQQMDPETQENLKVIWENLKDLIGHTETPKP
ncbi:uncharacterized protein LOC126455741 [Schistocerca serialis cubense]|uniref:uncharacterized protein LOC126455741 n=1 Tax=Schistocerca serialis cubense TaxID=2023355 RepID=UPI00214E7EFA|nr:uncharacterized protein LOC126455741 [Schistocerca serialis cubense]